MNKKNKLPKIAIELIVSMRQDKYHNYTYEDIAKKIKEDFGITVTKQAVYYQYSRNKDLVIPNITSVPAGNNNPSPTFLNDNQGSLDRINSIKKNLNATSSRKEYKELTDDEFEQLMKGD